MQPNFQGGLKQARHLVRVNDRPRSGTVKAGTLESRAQKRGNSKLPSFCCTEKGLDCWVHNPTVDFGGLGTAQHSRVSRIPLVQKARLALQSVLFQYSFSTLSVLFQYSFSTLSVLFQYSFGTLERGSAKCGSKRHLFARFEARPFWPPFKTTPQKGYPQ